MSEGFHPHILNPFSRAEESGQTRYKARTWVWRSAEYCAHDERLPLKFRHFGNGQCQFIVAVPFDLCLEAEENNEELSGLPVLVMDDDRIICEVLPRFWMNWGCGATGCCPAKRRFAAVDAQGQRRLFFCDPGLEDAGNGRAADPQGNPEKAGHGCPHHHYFSL